LPWKGNIFMGKLPWRDRSFLVPIGIGIFSILGIVIALSIVYLDEPEAPPPATLTLTPFKFLFLGTETSIPSPDLEITPVEETFPEEPGEPILIATLSVDTPQAASPTFSAPASSPASTATSNIFQISSPTIGPIATTSTVSTAVTPSTAVTVTATTASTAAERLDNTDPLLDYDGDWAHQSNVAGAYQGTLSVSTEVDSDLIFTFTGRQLIIGYVGGAGLGTLAISIDDNDFQLNQSTGREWTSPQLPETEDGHLVIIFHESGTSVNLDYISIISSQ
jgi:hypothetical protein